MIDLAFLAFIGFVLVLGLKRPFIWVLLYVYIDILAPQRIGYGLITSIPVSLIAFAAAFGGWLLLDKAKTSARFSFRQGLMVLLLAYCFWTTQNAAFPEAAQFKWEWVWKALLFGIFLPLTLTTRARLEGLALVLVLSIGTIVISTGIKTVLGGGGYENLKFFVKDNSGIYESSTLATMAIALVPMIWWFTRFGTVFRPHWLVTGFALALTLACFLVPIGTEARTGLLCIAVLGLMALRYVKRRVLFLAGGAVLGLAALPFLPQSYYDRMATLGQPSGDESASTRVAVWEWTIDYARDNPFGGGFDAYLGNKFTYVMPVKEVDGNTVSVKYKPVTDEARAFHSAIFEVLGEQGYPGLAIWVLLHLSGLWQMERIRARWKDRSGEAEVWVAPFAVALQLASVIYIVGALFQGIAYQPVMLMLIGLQIGLHTYCGRVDSLRPKQPGREPVRRPSRTRPRRAVTA
ncbi:MAG: putative O-glycosylation ligase, exosortase A system-associated [Erythrobacter sp. SCN 62-14]|nr:MAG: putative O-glycosylation ligase, exosortase A system-associated [Erythrobacter sp. SCN 62-14]